MAEFQVTSNEVQSKSLELQNLAKQMRSKIDEMDQIEQNLAGMWEGDAHEAFRSNYTQSKQKMMTFVNALEKYFLTLNDIAVTYHNSENKNIQTANNQ